MKVLARCLDRVLVRRDHATVSEVRLGDDAVITEGQLEGTAPENARTPVELAWDELEVHRCDGCTINYGPRGTPSGDHGCFQQFALQHGSHPWSSSGPGWYCMSCSMPPR